MFGPGAAGAWHAEGVLGAAALSTGLPIIARLVAVQMDQAGCEDAWAEVGREDRR